MIDFIQHKSKCYLLSYDLLGKLLDGILYFMCRNSQLIIKLHIYNFRSQNEVYEGWKQSKNYVGPSTCTKRPYKEENFLKIINNISTSFGLTLRLQFGMQERFLNVPNKFLCFQGHCWARKIQNVHQVTFQRNKGNLTEVIYSFMMKLFHHNTDSILVI